MVAAAKTRFLSGIQRLQFPLRPLHSDDKTLSHHSDSSGHRSRCVPGRRSSISYVWRCCHETITYRIRTQTRTHARVEQDVRTLRRPLRASWQPEAIWWDSSDKKWNPCPCDYGNYAKEVISLSRAAEFFLYVFLLNLARSAAPTY